MVVPQKGKIQLPYNISEYLLGIYLNECKSVYSRKCQNLYLLQPRYGIRLGANQQMNKMCDIHINIITCITYITVTISVSSIYHASIYLSIIYLSILYNGVLSAKNKNKV
jgi:hypothetical protein